MKQLTVLRKGSLASIQDNGRFHVRHLGVTQGGAMDWIAMYWANFLLGNDLNAPVIEVMFGGLRLRAEDDVCLALCGADLNAQIDDVAIAPWQSVLLKKGQVLSFSQPRNGLRSYIAVPNGFITPRLMGSASTVTREQIGGLHNDGSALQDEDCLQWQGHNPAPKQLNQAHIPNYQSAAPFEVILGAQVELFSGASLFAAFNEEWQVDTRADRMGVRLQGPKLSCATSNMISEGVPLGGIQVPSDGQPIILMNDRQTIGGYPRLGALTPIALTRLAQLMPGAKLKLKVTTLEQAQHQQRALLKQWQ